MRAALLFGSIIIIASCYTAQARPNFTREVGIKCMDCHDAAAGFHAPTTKPMYAIAKGMIAKYKDKTCISCHNGKPKP
jgi:hypothetical protein